MGNKKSEPASYLWLLLGILLLIFSNGIFHIIPAATWLAPVFLIRFLRTHVKKRGVFLFLMFYLTAWVIMLYGLYSGMPPWVSVVTGLLYGIFFFLAFWADRLIVSKKNGFAGTLVFPTAVVTIEFFLSLTPGNSWFSLAYTQPLLPLMQLASVTGMWGISFLIAWFASVSNWAWEHEFSLPVIRKGIILYLGILVLIVLLGQAYMTFMPAGSDTVRVAAITRSFDMDIEAAKCKGETPCIEELFKRSLDEFLGDSKEAVNRGAEIIVWQENALAIYEKDEPDYVERGREFAVKEKVYLLMGVYMLSEGGTPDENKAFLITPSGDVSEYLKNYLVPGDSHALGDGKALVQDSEYGRLSTIICQDTHTINFVRQIGKDNVDILLIPNHNWASITPYVATMANFRAIENGFSMIRADYHGLSTAVDFHGNMLAEMNDFETEERIMLADMPQQGVTTVYSKTGYSFAFLCVFGFFVLVVFSMRNRKTIGVDSSGGDHG
jgi:apolipoprotein N-acyltransferase